ncbi:hypothetical protein Ancab_034866 [Ancistrocladus abbreviatus]
MLANYLSSSFFLPSLRFLSSSAQLRVLKIGDVLQKTRIFSDLDVIEYSKVSHDTNPLHFDAEFAKNAGFQDRVVYGMLVASLFPQIISAHFPGAIYASQSLHFKLPVYVGEEIVGKVEATIVRENKKKYLVKFLTKCFKNGDLLVLDGEALAVLPTLSIE